LWSSNTYKWIIIQYACARIGAVLCTLNPYYKLPELEYTLKKADVKVLFMPGKQSTQKALNNYQEIINSPELHRSLRNVSKPARFAFRH